MERREQRNVNLTSEPPVGRRTEERGSKGKEDFELVLDSWVRIGLASKRGELFNNLFCHFSAENLRLAFRALDGSKAKGVDGVSKSDYGQKLEENIADLLNRLHKGTYRPTAKRQVMIPKANGKTRPIAISAFEDKMVEWVLGKILESVYEPDFIKHSYGFRPGKSAHDAIEVSYSAMSKGQRPYVVEIDLANFFNTVPHRKLMKLIYQRVRDRRLLGLIARFLKGNILEGTGKLSKQEIGTPQGSIMSPILANIYLHYALDTWFIKNYKSKSAIIVRYADDAIFLFQKENEAQDFLVALKARLIEAKLTLNEDKTSLIDLTKTGHQKFDFLGFSFYWAYKNSKKQYVLSIKTALSSLNRKIQTYKEWIKRYRNQMKIDKLWKLTDAKLRGHYAYYGYFCNKAKLNHYYYAVIGSLFKWLNRRSQKRSFTWETFLARMKHMPLTRPPAMDALNSIGWNPYAITH